MNIIELFAKSVKPGTKMPILVEIQGEMWKNVKKVDCLEMGR